MRGSLWEDAHEVATRQQDDSERLATAGLQERG